MNADLLEQRLLSIGKSEPVQEQTTTAFGTKLCRNM